MHKQIYNYNCTVQKVYMYIVYVFTCVYIWNGVKKGIYDEGRNIRKRGNCSQRPRYQREWTMRDNGIASDFCMPISFLLHCVVDNAPIIALNGYHSYAHSDEFKPPLSYPLSLRERNLNIIEQSREGMKNFYFFYFSFFFSFLMKAKGESGQDKVRGIIFEHILWWKKICLDIY